MTPEERALLATAAGRRKRKAGRRAVIVQCGRCGVKDTVAVSAAGTVSVVTNAAGETSMNGLAVRKVLTPAGEVWVHLNRMLVEERDEESGRDRHRPLFEPCGKLHFFDLPVS